MARHITTNRLIALNMNTMMKNGQEIVRERMKRMKDVTRITVRKMSSAADNVQTNTSSVTSPQSHFTLF